MPSLPVRLVILLFWGATTAWMLQREVLPRFLTGDPPGIAFDLSDEVGAQAINWKISWKDETVGRGHSEVRRLPDRQFELRSRFDFSNLNLLKQLEIRKLISTYQVTSEGHLRGLSTEATVREAADPDKKGGFLAEMKLEVIGQVKDEKLTLRFLIQGQEWPFFPPEPVPLAQSGSILNPMHLLNRVRGLRPGKRWVLPLLNPMMSTLPVQGLALPRLEAEVHLDTLRWNRQQIDCYRIDYRQPDQKLAARTWARREDGLVLQQEAIHQGIDLVLVRDPN